MQFYVLEIQQDANGNYGHIVHTANDENPKTARLKAEAKYHEILAYAAISGLPSHSVTLLSSKGEVINNEYYSQSNS